MTIRIITDSAADIEQNSMENLIIVPLKVTIDGVTYRDGIDMSKDQFFEKLENSDTLPVTSLASPFEFEEVYKKITEEGDEAIVLALSSELSGTCQSAMIAAADYDNIDVVDTRAVSIGQMLLVRRAFELINHGLTRKEIVETLEVEKKKVKFYAIVDTLKYLEKGGRLSKGAALVGGLVGIKPILEIVDGSLVPSAKARGAKQAQRVLTERVHELSVVDYSKPIVFGYSGTKIEVIDKYLSVHGQTFTKLQKFEKRQLGSAVGTHAGPGTIVVSYFEQ